MYRTLIIALAVDILREAEAPNAADALRAVLRHDAMLKAEVLDMTPAARAALVREIAAAK